LVVAELLEEFGVVLDQGGHDAAQSLVVLDSGVLRGVFHCILERGVDEAASQENRLRGGIGRLPIGTGTFVSRTGRGLLCGFKVGVCAR
jgi:hypothetical protein